MNYNLLIIGKFNIVKIISYVFTNRHLKMGDVEIKIVV